MKAQKKGTSSGKSSFPAVCSNPIAHNNHYETEHVLNWLKSPGKGYLLHLLIYNTSDYEASVNHSQTDPSVRQLATSKHSILRVDSLENVLVVRLYNLFRS